MKSRAAILRHTHEPLEIDMVDVRAPGLHEVLVEFKATGLCHTDLHLIEGSLPTPLPSVLGHEGAGIVRDVGPGVTYVEPGDHVIGHPIPQCGTCDYCHSDKTNLCMEMLSGESEKRTGFSRNGTRVGAFMGLGTFGNFAILHENQVAKVRRDAPLEKICTIGCGVATGIGSALICTKVESGSSVLVIGLGAIGLAVIQGARIAGAKTIIGVDTNEAKEAAARRVGATDFINPKKLPEGLVDHVIERTNGGADFTFECVGSTTLMEQALACTHVGWGVCTIVGVAPPDAVMSVSPMALLHGRRLVSNIHGNTRVRRDFPRIVDWFMEGKIDLDALVSDILPLERINDGFSLMRAGKTIRPVVVF